MFKKEKWKFSFKVKWKSKSIFGKNFLNLLQKNLIKDYDWIWRFKSVKVI